MTEKLLVHFRGPANTQSGYGVHSRQILDYLLSDERFVVCFESISWGHTPFIHGDERLQAYYQAMVRLQQAQSQQVQFNISIQCTIPNEFKRVAEFNIGVTAGIEVDRCTVEWIKKCNDMDLIVVPSEFSKKVLSSTVYNWHNKENGQKGELKIVKPIIVIPEWFEQGNIEPLDLSFDTEVNFLHVGQWGNKGGFGEDRKNIADLVRLFLMTFKDEPKAGLVLKVNIINNSQEDFDVCSKRLNEIKSNFPDVKCSIYLVHNNLTDAQMRGLYSHPQIKAFVSLTHGEGWGLPLLEAAAHGLPVLATNWSGHLDFLREKNGFIPIDFSMVHIPECQVWENVMDKGSAWAKVNDEDVQKKLRKFFKSPSLPREKAKENVSWLNDNFSKDAVLKRWRRLFDDLIHEEGQDDQPSNEGSVLPSTLTNPKASAISKLNALVSPSTLEKVLFIMPRSAGDCLLSTAVIDSLINSRHAKDKSDFYVATLPEYKSLFSALDVKIVDFCEEMMTTELTKEVWDVVYNPGVNIQYVFSNWLLGNGEYAVRLFEEIAKNCNLSPKEITNYMVPVEEFSLPKRDYIVFCPGGIKSAKVYKYWDDVLANIKDMLPDVDVVQLGSLKEKLYDGCLDYRRLNFAQSAYVVKNAKLGVSVDTFGAHLMAAMEVPHVVLYGCTHANTCAPVVLGKPTPQILIESSYRQNGCPSYRDVCPSEKHGKNCLSHIDPKSVCLSIFDLISQVYQQDNQ